jgi:pantoate--beta-alanine ligase
LITVASLAELRGGVAGARDSGKSIAFVPTMGALHEGHLTLVRRAKAEAEFVVVSIFVNPLQFAPNEDLARYPRLPEKDAALLESAGADLLYRPDEGAFYAKGFSTAVEVSGVTEGGEGEVRPGHFRGVATVVAKLFLQVSPDVAVFGRKDLQQAAVVRRMIRDLDFPIRLVVADTVREEDGLALSSRNAYLSPEERRQAAALPRALFAARELAAHGAGDPNLLSRVTRDALEDAGFDVDYVQVVDPETMRPLERLSPGATIAAAVRVGKTRLIDNVPLLAGPEGG